jgi:outer membrane biosynthesis protein TonB
MKSLQAIIGFFLCLSLNAQVSSFDEMEFEADSIRTTYKPAGKHYAFLRSKRGTSGLNRTSKADSIKSFPVTEIILVYSELNSSAIEEREEANRERWENLLLTYPEFFQFSTTYKNICQCNNHGDSAAFKHAQGFYVYFTAEDVPSSPPPPPPPPVQSKAPVKEVAAVDRTEVKTKETPPIKEEPVKEKPVKEKPEPIKEKQEVAKEPEQPSEVENTEESAPAKTEVAKATPKKKTGAAAVNKPRRAKDPRACRAACYGWGDEDLLIFFKDNITLTKKQRRKAKNWTANVRLQIHHDGSIKKAIVTGNNDNFNKLLDDVLKKMNNWNAAVKSGVAVKSEVRFNLKFDKSSKAFRPSDFIMNPKASPKCPCVQDSEMFGD